MHYLHHVQNRLNYSKTLSTKRKTHMVPAMKKARHNNFNFQPFLSTFDEINKHSSTTQNITTFIDEKDELFTSHQMTDEIEVINRKINTVKELCNRKFSQKGMKHSIMKQSLQDLLSNIATTLANYKMNQNTLTNNFTFYNI